VFWVDKEARVQIAPSGMMKKRNDGLIIFLTPLWRRRLPMIAGIAAKFFRVMLSIVSIVSWPVTIWQSRSPALWGRAHA
jgi:hypothetical protein